MIPRAFLRAATALLCIASSLASLAQSKADHGYWRAGSKTAASITGDIEITDAKIIINFTGFEIVPARTLTPAEVSAAFDADVNAGGTGTLYHLAIPADKRFLHKNTLCGTEDTQWMATFASGTGLQLAFFSGPAAPVFNIDALANSTDLCGTFTYAR